MSEKNLNFTFIFYRYFHWVLSSSLTVFFLLSLLNWEAPLSSCLPCFQQEICCHPYLCSSVYSTPVFLWLLSGFSFYHWFWWLIWLCMSWCSFLYSSEAWGWLGFLDLWVYRLYQIWIFSAITVLNIFLSLFPFWKLQLYEYQFAWIKTKTKFPDYSPGFFSCHCSAIFSCLVCLCSVPHVCRHFECVLQ